MPQKDFLKDIIFLNNSSVVNLQTNREDNTEFPHVLYPVSSITNVLHVNVWYICYN